MTPGSDLAEALSRQIERWSLAAGAAPGNARAARNAAQALALAMAEGHVCLDLAGSGDRAALLASGVVGRAEAPGAMPLVLDADDRLYLQRYFDYERRLAQRLLRTRGPALRGDTAALRRELDARFAAHDAGLGPDWQKLAAALALRGRLTVVSGGPGTGKTTTVVALLACLVAQDPACRVALAAPTGKAAARLTEAIAQQAAHLPPGIRAALPKDAFTVHRLLEAGPTGFARHAGNPLAIDLLIVDEASMLDLALATRLLEAVPDAARIVLLGDQDQLAAVESGAVFAELSADPSLSDACRAELAALTGIETSAIAPPAPARPGVLRDSTIWLRRSYRFGADSAIARLASAIRSGDAPAALAAAGARLDDSAVLDHAVQGYAPLLQALREGAPAAAVHAAFARYRVLAALREGPRGVAALNAQIEQHWRAALGGLDRAPRSPWYPGRPVLVQRNDALLKLFNGDIGIALPDPASGAIEVVFQRADGSLQRIAPVRVPEHETAFAMTVHKAQGSEFDAVLVLLPAQATSRMLTRELLYTAVTRARTAVTLCAAPEVLAAAVGNVTRRHSGLLARLADAAAERWPAGD